MTRLQYSKLSKGEVIQDHNLIVVVYFFFHNKYQENHKQWNEIVLNSLSMAHK